MPTYRHTCPNQECEFWLAKNPCPLDDGRHRWIFDAACAFHQRGLPEVEAYRLIETNLTRNQRHNEIRHALNNAYATTGNFTSKAKVAYPSYNPDTLAEIASRIPFEITDDYLAEVSPDYCLDISPSDYLDSVFRGIERVAIMNAKNDKGWIYKAGDEKSAKVLSKYASYGREGAWYIANPVNGSWIDGSIRREANLTSYRHLVLESDKAPRELWLAMLVQLYLPILAIYTSGNRSIHALVRIPATNKQEFNEIAGEYCRQLCQLGADAAAMTAVRATRLPGIVRRDNGREQKLLYLNSEPTDSPIYCP